MGHHYHCWLFRLLRISSCLLLLCATTAEDSAVAHNFCAPMLHQIDATSICSACDPLWLECNIVCMPPNATVGHLQQNCLLVGGFQLHRYHAEGHAVHVAHG